MKKLLKEILPHPSLQPALVPYCPKQKEYRCQSADTMWQEEYLHPFLATDTFIAISVSDKPGHFLAQSWFTLELPGRLSEITSV